jgi:hypothetical protein
MNGLGGDSFPSFIKEEASLFPGSNLQAKNTELILLKKSSAKLLFTPTFAIKNL